MLGWDRQLMIRRETSRRRKGAPLLSLPIWRPNEVPRWNFHKYLIGRDGYLAEVFASAVEPTDTRVKTAIAKALAES
jgi:glutathione peroxidase-family protein